MRILKALFGGIFAIFGILFGGLWDTVVGAFKSTDDTEEQTEVMASVSSPQPSSPAISASPQPAPTPTPAPDPTPAPAPTPSPSLETSSDATPSAPFPAFSPDLMAAPQPRRRPGKTMTLFKEMAREISSARR